MVSCLRIMSGPDLDRDVAAFTDEAHRAPRSWRCAPRLMRPGRRARWCRASGRHPFPCVSSLIAGDRIVGAGIDHRGRHRSPWRAAGRSGAERRASDHARPPWRLRAGSPTGRPGPGRRSRWCRDPTGLIRRRRARRRLPVPHADPRRPGLERQRVRAGAPRVLGRQPSYRAALRAVTRWRRKRQMPSPHSCDQPTRQCSHTPPADVVVDHGRGRRLRAWRSGTPDPIAATTPQGSWPPISGPSTLPRPSAAAPPIRAVVLEVAAAHARGP